MTSWPMRRCPFITSLPIVNAPSLWLVPQTAGTMSCVGGFCPLNRKSLPSLFHVSPQVVMARGCGYVKYCIHQQLISRFQMWDQLILKSFDICQFRFRFLFCKSQIQPFIFLTPFMTQTQPETQGYMSGTGVSTISWVGPASKATCQRGSSLSLGSMRRTCTAPAPTRSDTSSTLDASVCSACTPG